MPADGTPLLYLTAHLGGLRVRRVYLQFVVVAGALAIQFGLAGIVFAAWYLHREVRRFESPVWRVRVYPRDVGYVWMGPDLVVWGPDRLSAVGLFRDELAASEFALLRRTLKAAVAG